MPRDGDRPQELLERRLGRRRHPRSGLGAEVLDDHLLHVAVALGELADRAAAPRSRSARVSPMPIRMPVVNGTRSSPAAAIVASRTRRRLVGRAEVRPAARRQPLGRRLEHQRPSTPLTGRSARTSSRVMTPGLRCGSRPVSSSTAAAARRRYSSVVSHPSAAELLARRAVAQLRLVAEREQRLAAAGGGAGPGDREHLVDASGTRARLAAAGARTCSSGRRRGRASSAG